MELDGRKVGRVGHDHLQGYLDEYAFRFNRRKSRHVGRIFHRLTEQLVLRQGRTHRRIAEGPGQGWSWMDNQFARKSA